MVMGVGKRSEIRLKSENFDPCDYETPLCQHNNETVRLSIKSAMPDWPIFNPVEV